MSLCVAGKNINSYNVPATKSVLWSTRLRRRKMVMKKKKRKNDARRKNYLIRCDEKIASLCAKGLLLIRCLQIFIDNFY